MLIDFRIKNFRSMRDEQIFSMEANGGRSEHAEVLRQPEGVARAMRLLPVAAVFGPNASGKTTLFRAMDFMRQMVLRSFATSDDERSPIHLAVPFRLDAESAERPAEFELTFVTNAVRYRYAFAVFDQRIMSESLHTWPKGKQALVFERKGQPGEPISDFRFSESIEGGKERAQFVAEQTHPQALYLSTAQKLNHPAVKSTFEWVKHSLRVLDHTNMMHRIYTSKQFLEQEVAKDWTNMLMRWADLGIEEMEVAKPDIEPDFAALASAAKDSKLRVQISQALRQVHQVKAVHRAADGSLVAFDLSGDESHGTERMFGLAGPIWDVLENGRTLFVDELSTGFHHWVVRQLVSLFQNPVTNPNHAQLIFTSHDPLLLDLTLLRRDQINFVKKDTAGVSELYSLADIKTKDGARKDSVQLHKHYLSGAFGAIPHLGNLSDLTRGLSDK